MEAQMQGAVAYALSALVHEEITVAGGKVQQGNFDDYPVLTMAEMPDVRVVAIGQDNPIGGVGEPGYPPLGPAVLNALFDATGIRVRKLPLDRNFRS
jgi:isoquinoline 1-oxidoreductase beta subunit